MDANSSNLLIYKLFFSSLTWLEMVIFAAWMIKKY